MVVQGAEGADHVRQVLHAMACDVPARLPYDQGETALRGDAAEEITGHWARLGTRAAGMPTDRFGVPWVVAARPPPGRQPVKELGMRTRTLCRTGEQVGPYCPGTMMFGQAGNPARQPPGRHAPRAKPQTGRRARRGMMIR
ncbi:hypothetical protein E1292_45095 [Nonomuraea deserti]|uniref:Uncharacterized protein n=1 Tax=Nonomuraea deserti TaxID=1848322 RepID=A0A4R4UCE0_9ACTN|nr:hypothetical protein [Nonomuraea deserti]TDC88920.1 hypothetical protein E1292_45095 [Nonomuraea deserti]